MEDAAEESQSEPSRKGKTPSAIAGFEDRRKTQTKEGGQLLEGVKGQENSLQRLQKEYSLAFFILSQ